MDENIIRQMRLDIAELQAKVFNRPKAIVSVNLMGDLITKYDVTASQASDIIYRINKGELKTDKDIENHVKEQASNIKRVQNNKNKGGESN